jgi:hypothetical protein
MWGDIDLRQCSERRESRLTATGATGKGVFSTIPQGCTELILVATEKKIRYFTA